MNLDELKPHQLIADNGRSRVYRVQQGSHTLAVKVLESTSDDRTRSQFRREASAMALLNHPGIVRVVEFDDSGSRPHIVMDFIEGRSLHAALDGGSLSVEQTVSLASELCGALSALHHRGLVHKDLTPRNILLDSPGVPEDHRLWTDASE